MLWMFSICADTRSKIWIIIIQMFHYSNVWKILKVNISSFLGFFQNRWDSIIRVLVEHSYMPPKCSLLVCEKYILEWRLKGGRGGGEQENGLYT